MFTRHHNLLSAIVALSLGSLGSLGCMAEVGAPGVSAEETNQSKSDALLTDYYSFFLYGGFTLSFDLAAHGLNGQTWNGKALDGHAVTRVSLSDVRVDDHGREADLRLVGTEFKLAKAGGSSGGKPMVGATFTGTLDDGDAISLRIDDAVAGQGVNQDVTRYLVSYETAEGWRSFCGNAADGSPVRAIPLAGRWDYRAGVAGGGGHIDDASSFTFACEGKVLAECVTMGYKPWVSGKLCAGKKNSASCRDVSIADYHQACTRMLRADYCGDGVAHTVDGTMISGYDALGIRVDTDHFAFEAEWTPAGARCAARQRIAGPAPTCWSSLQKADCGADADFLDGTLLMSGVQAH